MKGRCFAVLVLLGSLVSLAQAQNGFGRFGFTSAPSVAGFTVSRSGLKNHFAGSDAILFASEQKKWTPLLTSPFRQVIGCDGTVGSPSKVRLDVLRLDGHILLHENRYYDSSHVELINQNEE